MDNNPRLHSAESESDKETVASTPSPPLVMNFILPCQPPETDYAFSDGNGNFMGSFSSVQGAQAVLEATVQLDHPILDFSDASFIRNEDVLLSKFVQDHHLTNNVLAQISRIAANLGERENMYALLYSENRGVYYCIHEVCEKGKLSSQALDPGQSDCPVHGANCSFMVKVVTVGSSSKFQVINPNVAIPDTH